jgi:hypothetical protein
MGAIGLATPTAPGPIALVNIPANDELPPAAADGWAEEGWVGVGGAKAVWSDSMRATTDSMLTPG